MAIDVGDMRPVTESKLGIPCETCNTPATPETIQWPQSTN